MVNSLYYCCWRVVSEVHKLGCILAAWGLWILEHAITY
jgi:hypothetical protein